MIEQKITNIVDLFHTKLDSFNRIKVPIEQIKEEPIPMEVTAQNWQSNESQHQYDTCSDDVVTSNLNRIKEK